MRISTQQSGQATFVCGVHTLERALVDGAQRLGRLAAKGHSAVVAVRRVLEAAKVALGQTHVHPQRQQPTMVLGRGRGDGLGGAARALQRARPDGGERLFGEPASERVGLAQTKVGQRRVGATLQPAFDVAHRLGAAAQGTPRCCAASGVSGRDATFATAAPHVLPCQPKAQYRADAPGRRGDIVGPRRRLAQPIGGHGVPPL